MFNFSNTKQYYFKLSFIFSSLHGGILKHSAFGKKLL